MNAACIKTPQDEKKRSNVIDLTALESEKARNQTRTCLVAFLAAVVLAAGFFMSGILLPRWVETITPLTVWWSMTLEAFGFGFTLVSRWINRNAL